MACRHARTATNGFVPNWDLAAPLLAGRFVQCIDCREVLPLGPASDTPEVELEILSVEVALRHVDGEDDGLGFSDGLNFWAGWGGIDEMPPPDAWEPRMYAAGALAREICGENGP